MKNKAEKRFTALYGTADGAADGAVYGVAGGAACGAVLPAEGRAGLSVRIEGMTPDEYADGGMSLNIDYSFADTPFGTVMVASTAKGVCRLEFVDDGEAAAEERLKGVFPKAKYRRFRNGDHRNALYAFTHETGGTHREKDVHKMDAPVPCEVRLHVKGTAFQLKVWEALLRVPAGRLTTYSALALESGHKDAQRAVGTALGNNPVVLLVPCHRVIKTSGDLGNYHYGKERKAAIIEWECAAGQSARGRR